jgi:hypothetical protein
VSNALGRWSDELTFANPDVLANYPGAEEVILTLMARADGIGSNGGVTLEGYAFSSVSGTLGEDRATVQFGDGYSSGPLQIQFAILATELQNAPATLDLSLSVATSNTINSGESADLDFFHTAFLLPIVISDMEGNPVPELAGLRIVGSSGHEYPVTMIPEPVGGALLAIGALHFAGLAGRRQCLVRAV